MLFHSGTNPFGFGLKQQRKGYMELNTAVQTLASAVIIFSMFMVAANAYEDRQFHPVTLRFWAVNGFIPASFVMCLTLTFPL